MLQISLSINLSLLRLDWMRLSRRRSCAWAFRTTIHRRYRFYAHSCSRWTRSYVPIFRMSSPFIASYAHTRTLTPNREYSRYMNDSLSHPLSLSRYVTQAGRGRTGTLIACLLMALARRQALVEAAGGGILPGSLVGHGPLPQGRFPSKPFPALEYFAERRSSTKEGVAVPSQLRFARYYHALLYASDSPELPMPPVRRRLLLKSIEGSPVPMFALSEGFVPVFELLDLERYYASPLHITSATRYVSL